MIESGIFVTGLRFVPTKCEVAFMDGASLLCAESISRSGARKTLLFVGKTRKVLVFACCDATEFDIEDMQQTEARLRKTLAQLHKANY